MKHKALSNTPTTALMIWSEITHIRLSNMHMCYWSRGHFSIYNIVNPPPEYSQSPSFDSWRLQKLEPFWLLLSVNSSVFTIMCQCMWQSSIVFKPWKCPVVTLFVQATDCTCQWVFTISYIIQTRLILSPDTLLQLLYLCDIYCYTLLEVGYTYTNQNR